MASNLSTRQQVAITILIAVAIVLVVMWWFRQKPKDMVFTGPENVGPAEKTDTPNNTYIQLMQEDMIPKKAGKNLTCSFFVYVNSASVNTIPMNYDGSYKFKYLLSIGDVIGVMMNPAKQMCTLDILQSVPAVPMGDTIAKKVAAGAAVRTLDVENVLVSRWNQLTVCVEGRTVDVYINGKLGASAILDNVPARMFSGLKLNKSPDFEGQVCLFQMWKERRSGRQILENYKQNSDVRGRPIVPEPSLTLAGAWDQFLKGTCETTGFCGFPVKVGPMEYVEYEF